MPNTSPASAPAAANPTPLTPPERAALRAAAHALRPVVLVGERGLSEAVLKEIDRALAAHQLIKVRAASQERDAREAMLAEICAALACHPVHHLGKMLILYRASPVLEAAAHPHAHSHTHPHARKASEPYVSKKRAAAGKPAGKTPTQPPARRKATSSAAKREPVGPKKPLARKTAAAPRTSARTGSALSLRAGARNASRNIARNVGARKTSSRSR